MDKDLIWAIVLLSIMMIAIIRDDIRNERMYLHSQIDKNCLGVYNWDSWFERDTKKICHERYCLMRLDENPHLEKRFWLNIQKLNIHVEKDKKFQRFLIDYDDTWHVFKHLVYSYGLHYDFLPELVEIMNTDERFQSAKEAYEKGKADRKS